MKTLALHIVSLLTLAGSVSAQYASLQVPKQIQYQGRVSTGTGGAWTGPEGYFAFALVQGAAVLWNNWEGTASPSDPGTVSLGAGQVLTLPVNQGVFSVRIGEGSDTNEQIPATVFFDITSNSVRADVKLAVWFSPDGGAFTRLSPDVEFSSVPYAMVAGIAETVKERAVTQNMLASTAAVPVGGVVMWYGDVANIPLGFELCDGTAVTTAGATFQGNKPNLLDRFVKGAGIGTITRAALSTGGTHTVSAQSGLATDGRALSIAQMPSHTHTDSGHSHTIAGNQFRYAGVPRGVGIGVVEASNTEPNDAGVVRVTAGAAANIQAAGGISGVTQPHDHTFTIPARENRPAFHELFFIIRVK